MSASRKPRKTRAKADHFLDLEGQGATLSPVADFARGLGQDTRYTFFRRPREIGPEEVRGIYSDGLGRRIVELPVQLALRAWPSIDVEPAYREAAEQVAEGAEALDLQRWVSRAAIWARRDGWSLSIQGWRSLVGEGLQPWPEVRRPVGSDLVWVRAAYRWDCANPTAYFGPDSPHFGEPRWIGVYRMRPDVEGDVGYLEGSHLGSVHGSRFTRLSTTTGRTEYERVAQYLAQLLAGGGGVAGALSRANVGVFTIPDFASKARRNDAEAYGRIRAHFEALSTFAPLVIDGGSNGKGAESFEMISNGALGGTENALFALSWLVSAACGIPMSELFGLEPGGFSSGEETTARWHDSLEETRRWVEPAIRAVYDGLFARALGREAVPAYRLVWAPVRSPSLEERSSLTTSLLGAAASSISLGLASPDSIRAGLAATPEADLWAWEIEPAPVDPGALDVPTLAPITPAAAETALNGAQTASFVQVLQEVATGSIDPDAAIGLLQIAFPAASDALIRQIVAAQARAREAIAPTPAAPASSAPPPAAAPEVEDGEEAAGVPPAPAPPPPGTWLEAEEAAVRCGIAPKKIKSLGARGKIHRRKLGASWEYRLEDLYEVAASSIEGPDVEPEDADEGLAAIAASDLKRVR